MKAKDGALPSVIHHCDPEQFIEFGTTVRDLNLRGRIEEDWNLTNATRTAPRRERHQTWYWLKADFGFSDRLKIFCLGMRTALVHDIVNVLRDNQDKPEYIEAFAKGLLHLYRPELSDACVLHMSYDMSMLSWRFLVSHGSF